MDERRATTIVKLGVTSACLLAGTAVAGPVGTAIGGVASEMLSGALEPYVSSLVSFLSDGSDPVGNSLRKTLERAYLASIDQIESDWNRRPTISEDGSEGLFASLREDANTIFSSSETFGEDILAKFTTVSDRRSSLGTLTKEYLDHQLRHQGEGLEDLVSKTLIPRTSQNFTSLLLNDETETNKAWRAIQLTAITGMFQVLNAQTTRSQFTDEQIQESLSLLEQAKDALAELSEQQRSDAGNAGLKLVLDEQTLVITEILRELEQSILSAIGADGAQTRQLLENRISQLKEELQRGTTFGRSSTNIIRVAATEPPFGHTQLVGRQSELDQTIRVVQRKRVVNLTGLSGMGKSLLAAAAIRQLRSTGDIETILWLDQELTTNERFMAEGIANAIGIPGYVDQSGDSLLGLVRSHLANLDRTAIVLDDVSGIAVARRAIDRLLPNNIAIIVISRQNLFLSGEHLSVGQLKTSDAEELFNSATNGVYSPNDVSTICALLENHPMAIRIIAGRLEVEQQPLSEILSRLRDEKHRLRTLKVGDLNVSAAIELSWQDLDQASRNLLATICWSSERASRDLIKEVFAEDKVDFYDTLGSLTAQSLVVSRGSHVHVHNLVRDFVRQHTVQQKEDVETRTHRRLLELVLDNGGNPHSPELAERLTSDIYPLTALVLGLIEATDINTSMAGVRIGQLLLEPTGILARGAFTSLRAKLATGIVKATDEATDYELVIFTALTCAPILAALGNQAGAIRLLARAENVASDDETKSKVLAARGELARQLGIDRDAYSSLIRSLNHAELAENTINEASAWGQLGAISLDYGLLASAHRRYGKALELYERAEFAPGIAAATYNLGRILDQLGFLEQARNFHHQSLVIEESLDNLPGILVSLDELIHLDTDEPYLDLAEQKYRARLARLQESGNREGEASLLGALGTLAIRRHKIECALALINQSLNLNRQDGDLQGEAVCEGNLGLIAYEQRELQSARKHALRSIELYGQLGDDRGIAMCSTQLGHICVLEGSWDEAINHFAKMMSWAHRHNPGAEFRSAQMISTIQSIIESDDDTLRSELTNQAMKFAEDYSVIDIPRVDTASRQAQVKAIHSILDQNDMSASCITLLAILPSIPIPANELESMLDGTCYIDSPSEELIAIIDQLGSMDLASHAHGSVYLAPETPRAVLSRVPAALLRETILRALSGMMEMWLAMPDDRPVTNYSTQFMGMILTLSAYCSILDLSSAELARLGGAAGAILSSDGSYVAAALVMEDGLNNAKLSFAPDSLDLISPLNNLAGLLHFNLNMHDESANLFEQIFSLVNEETQFTEEQLHTYACALSNYGHVRLAQDDVEGASILFESARSTHLSLHGEAHITYAVNTNNVGLVHKEQGNWVQARQHLELALDTFEATAHGDTFQAANTWDHLSGVHENLGDLPLALACAQKALAIRHQVLPPLHEHIVESHQQIGRLLLASGQAQEAKNSWNQALQLSLRAFGPYDYYTLQIRESLASIS